MIFTIALYLLIFAFVVGFVFYTVDGYRLLKIILLISIFWVSTSIIFSLDTYLGWPVDDGAAPNQMVLTSIVIYEKTKKTEGAIYVTGIPCPYGKPVKECQTSEKTETWMTVLKVFGYFPRTQNTPRLFSFPYTDENRKMFAAAAENLRNGGRSVFKRGRKDQPGDGEGGGVEGEGNADGTGGGNDQGGEGTRNAEATGAQEIYIENESLRDVLKKDQFR